MKRINKVIAAAVCCGVIAVATAGMALADPVVMGGGSVVSDDNGGGPGAASEEEGSTWATATVITGPVLQINDQFLLVSSVNGNGSGPVGMVSLGIDPDLTLFADATTGSPLTLSDIHEDDTIYAYVGPAMTLSLPPQLNASMILTNIPADGSSVPIFTKVSSVDDNGDGTYKLTVAGGATYLLPDDCQVSPFRTRNIFTVQDIKAGSNCLIWAGEGDIVIKVVIVQQ